MKRLLALLGGFLFLLPLTACSLFSELELPEPEPEAAAEEQPPEEAEPEGSKALTLIFAHEVDENRTALLESAQQTALEKGYTLSNVVTMGNAELQTRFLQLAQEAGEQAVLIELFDPATAADVVRDAGEMAVIFLDTAPDGNSALRKKAFYVGSPDGEGDAYLRLTGRVAMQAADNLIRGVDAGEETDVRPSGHKFNIPSDGILEE